MHELAITQNVVDAVRERTGDADVRAVALEIGKLSGVVADSVRFCFELVAEGTPLERATLTITEPAGQARCRTCGDEFDVDDLIALCACGSADITVARGKELRVTSVEVR
ncbi:hydrogenase maturation nickel metallochaperone HypA/HybF [Salinactinospora qingdaonensis]|uniref:Hydrogenase maturation factor HypA n=1 Tax=Salinactinospora qingdaonensis TaxID=702744 RepID=A0ABP7FE72_9ACTN